MELGKPSLVSILTAVILLALITYLAWSATKKTDSEMYSKGSSHNELTVAPIQNNYPLSIPGCGRFLTVQTPDGVRFIDQDKKAKK